MTSITQGKTPDYGGYALAGTSWSTGSVIVNFDYEKNNPLSANGRSFTQDVSPLTYLLPENKN
jgi:hypothetical protein